MCYGKIVSSAMKKTEEKKVTIDDLRKIRSWKHRLRKAVEWMPRMRAFAENVFPEVFKK
jgi:hypothetical protein